MKKKKIVFGCLMAVFMLLTTQVISAGQINSTMGKTSLRDLEQNKVIEKKEIKGCSKDTSTVTVREPWLLLYLIVAMYELRCHRAEIWYMLAGVSETRYGQITDIKYPILFLRGLMIETRAEIKKSIWLLCIENLIY